MPSSQKVGITRIKKAAREGILDPKEHPFLKVIQDMNDPAYCRKRALEESQLPEPNHSVVFTLLAMAKAIEDANT